MQIDTALNSLTQFTNLIRNAPLAFQAEDWSAIRSEIAALKKSGVDNLVKYFEANPGNLRQLMELAVPLYATPATTRLFQAPDEKSLASLRSGFALSADALSFTGKAIAAFIDGVSEIEGEVTSLRFDGTPLIMRLKITVAEGHQDDWSVVVISSEDNTEKRELVENLKAEKNRLEKVSQSKTAFLLDIGSEIMTPLNGIVNFADMMAQGVYGNLGAPQYEDYVRDIAQNAQQILSVIEDMRDLALIEQNRLHLQLDETSVEDCIDWCIEIMRPKAIEDGVRLHVQYGEDLPRLQADQRRLRQICQNTMIHAVNHACKDSVVSIRTRGNDSEGLTIETLFSVSEMTDMTNLFGLGMPLARTLTEMHRGKFWYKYDPKAEGSIEQTVFIWFPPELIIT